MKHKLGIQLENIGRILVLYGFLVILYNILHKIFHFDMNLFDYIFNWMYSFGLVVGNIITTFFLPIGFFVFYVGREIAD